MESSELARDVVEKRIGMVISKFPSLQGHQVTLTLEMENSPQQAGADVFTVSSMINGKIYKDLKLKRSSDHFYQAIAELADGLKVLLSRETDRLIKNLKRIKKHKENLYE